MTAPRHPDLDAFDQALADYERDTEQLAGQTRTDRGQCADCGTILTAFTRCQVVASGPDQHTSLVYLCPEHFRAWTGR